MGSAGGPLAPRRPMRTGACGWPRTISVPDAPAERVGELVALAQVLQVAGRGGHPDLAPHLARHAGHVTGTPVPITVTALEIPVLPALLARLRSPGRRVSPRPATLTITATKNHHMGGLFNSSMLDYHNQRPSFDIRF
ncbi:hypothetical protein [Streptomyces griseosporeus]|uniref:hypothetical protein n=1 Tax=Streptomyces griseosporeus TaxID=1910 RepID=UPI00167C8DD7|nr:hypothetical protein [Streptomyces griseosporeus]GHF50366.1 hypothetical protein GCM10018783_18690 [Streptomyces griseosporeus]